MKTRDQFVTSAQELLWERGYVAMSPKAVQDRAGAGQGSMYHHFKGKADLAAVAIEGLAAEFQYGAEKVLAAPGSSLERLERYMLRSREALKGCRVGKLTQDSEVVANVRLRHPLEVSLAWLQSRLRELIKASQAEGDLRPELKPSQLAATLVAVIQGGYVLAAAANSRKPFDQAIAGAVSLLHAARRTAP